MKHAEPTVPGRFGRTPEKATKHRALAATSFLLAGAVVLSGCEPGTTKPPAKPLSVAPLGHAADAPKIVRSRALGAQEIYLQQHKSKYNSQGTAERVSGNGKSWIITAGHVAMGTVGNPVDCDTTTPYIITDRVELSVANARTNYDRNKGLLSGKDLAIISPRNARQANKFLPSIPLGSEPAQGRLVYLSGVTVDHKSQVGHRTLNVGEYVGSYGNVNLVLEHAGDQVEGNSGGPVMNEYGEQFATISGGTEQPKTLQQLNESFGTTLVGGRSGEKFEMVEVTPVNAHVLGSLASAQRCDFQTP